MKKKETACCQNCIHRDYETYYGTSWVVVKKSCPWYAPWKDGNIREKRFFCKDYIRKEEFNFKYNKGDSVYVINKGYDKCKTAPIVKKKITKVNPTAIRCPYAIRLKDDEGTFEVWANEDELFDSYEEAKKAEMERLVNKIDELEIEYYHNKMDVIDKINYLDEYEESK